jgi:hypothetical protein
MKRKELKNQVYLAWATIERAAGGSSLLGKALAESERIEREHRAMGRRFLAGISRPRYALNVYDTARYFVAKITSERHPVPKSWREVTNWRADFPLCQALREEIKAAGNGAALVRTEGFKAIDYAGDIALKV